MPMSTRTAEPVGAPGRADVSAAPGVDRAQESPLEVGQDQLDTVAGGLRAQGMDYGD